MLTGFPKQVMSSSVVYRRKFLEIDQDGTAVHSVKRLNSSTVEIVDRDKSPARLPLKLFERETEQILTRSYHCWSG